jgi:GTP-binding protein EngB required for normal cell division/polyhydroxyalkanoate synthesis regulator phasin
MSATTDAAATTSRAALDEVLADVSLLAPPWAEPRVAEMARQWKTDRLRVLVVGEAKRGKSTLINAMLGRDVLPMGLTPLTAAATTVTSGTSEYVQASFTDGHAERRGLADLAELVTETGNPDNRLGLSDVVVHLVSPLPAAGIDLVDTPGAGSVFAHNTAAARQALATMDAAVFVLTTDPPISSSERDLLADVAGSSVATFVVLNKADRLAEQERAEVLAFTDDVVASILGRRQRIHALSARAALADAVGSDGPAPDPGFAAFLADFGAWLRQGRRTALHASLTRRTVALVDEMLDEITVTLRIDTMRAEADTAQVADFQAALTAFANRSQEAVDLIAGESRRLLAELNQAAADTIAHHAPAISANVADHVRGAAAESRTAEVEDSGQALALQAATALAESWRADQTGRLEQRLAALESRLREGLTADLGHVRAAARELLGVELVVPSAETVLTVDPRFHFPEVVPAGQTDLLAGAIRRRVPGRRGRTRLAEHLRKLAANLVDARIGRARGDLQYRLTETSRRLSADIRAAYQAVADRLAEAVRAAERIRDMTQTEGAAARAELTTRQGGLHALRARLAGEEGP